MNKRWFGGARSTDAELESRYGDTYEQAKSGMLEEWRSDPRGALALILLLDQFPRNMFRGREQMFATDVQALDIAQLLVARGSDKLLAPPERVFVYMCLEHSESLEVVRSAVDLFEELVQAYPHSFYKNQLRVAKNHLSTLEEFGRYPHRNEVLGRSSTDAERVHLLASKRRFVASVKTHTATIPLRVLVLHSFRQSGRRLRSRTQRMVKSLESVAELVFADAPHSYSATGTFHSELEEDFGDKMPDFAHQRCWWNSTANHTEYLGWDESLANRCSLESLFLGCNRLGDQGVTLLASALTKNTTIKRLGLASNRMGAEGVEAICEALGKNTTLRFLDLGWSRATVAVGELGNQIGNRGARRIAELLTETKTLMGLDISHSQISQSAIDDISDALDVNQSLVEIRLPQYGKAINHDSLDALDAKLDRNRKQLFSRGVSESDLQLVRTPKPTQEILSVYRTA